MTVNGPIEDDNLSRGDIEFLYLFDRLLNKFDRPPTDTELARASNNIGNTAIANRKKRLKGKGYLSHTSGMLTTKAVEEINSGRTVRQVYVPLLGTVSAGKRKQDELIVNMSTVTKSDFENIAIPKIAIPSTQKHENVFALNVDGVSMEDENIIDGDSIFVEPFEDGSFPSDGDLIVARYLPFYEMDSNIDWESEDISDEELAGPTLKYFYQLRDRYRLSVRKGHKDNRFTIETAYIRPVGKVIGIWRSV